MTSHPITPPLELVHQWADMLSSRSDHAVFSLAAQWGADQELKACCEWVCTMFGGHETWPDKLRTARRLDPPTLKEQALALLEVELGLNVEDLDLLRRALEGES
jgi:hypothetical protein